VVKILTYWCVLIFGGARPNLVSDAQAEHLGKKLMRTLSMRNCASVPYVHAHCSVQAAVPDPYAQCMHQFLMLIIDGFPTSNFRLADFTLGEFPDVTS
jgi:hypothetical protein